MAYFKYLPKLLYSTSNEAPNYKLVTNLLAKSAFITDALKNITIYYPYDIQDGEKPEDVANLFYNDPSKYWIVLMANNITDPQYDWVLDSNNFEKYINRKYSSQTLTLRGWMHPGEFVVGQEYTIYDLGTLTQQQWNDIAGTYQQIYEVGDTFTAAITGSNITDAIGKATPTLVNYELSEKVFQGGSTIDTSSVTGNVIDFSMNSPTHYHSVTVSFPTEVFEYLSGNTFLTGAASGASYAVIGVESNNDGYEWASNTRTGNIVTETRWNSYDQIKVTETVKISDDIPPEDSHEEFTLSDNNMLIIDRVYSEGYTYYQEESNKNEDRRHIKIVKPEYVGAIEAEFIKLMSA